MNQNNLSNQDPNQAPVPDSPLKRKFRFEHVVGFLMFYRRTIMGVILVAGVGYLLYWLASQDKNEDAILGDRTAVVVPKEFQPTREVSVGGQKKSAHVPLKDITKSDLIDRVIDAEQQWRSKPTAVAAVLLSRKLRLLRELYQRKLNNTEEEFCMSSYIQTASMLSSLSLRDDLDVTGIDAVLDELMPIYGEHEQPEIAAVANLAYVRREFDRFIQSNELADLEQAEDALNKSLPTIFLFDNALLELTNVVATAHLEPVHKADTLAVADRLIEKLRGDYERFAVALVSQIYLREVDIKGLVGRIQRNATDSRDDVIKLFETLEKYPELPGNVYSVAVTAIRIYQDRGQAEDAADLIDWLERIAEKVSIPEYKKVVEEAIKERRDYVVPENDSAFSTAGSTATK